MTQRKRGPRATIRRWSPMYEHSLPWIGSPTHRPIASRPQSSRGYATGNRTGTVRDVAYGDSGLPIACAFQLEAMNLLDSILEREDVKDFYRLRES